MPSEALTDPVYSDARVERLGVCRRLGIASGTATGTLGAYTNELSPPHLRNMLGMGLQISVTIGILFPAICFYFANTSTGWRYLAGFPAILAVLFLLLAPTMCVESPAWLLMKGRREEAKQVITRLYGEENVYLALSWLESSSKPDPEQALVNDLAQQRQEESLFSPKYRLPLACALLLSCTQQLCGINAVFYYSNSIFEDAGISDPRVGMLIIDFVNIWPAFFTGFLAKRFGNRKKKYPVRWILLFPGARGFDKKRRR